MRSLAGLLLLSGLSVVACSQETAPSPPPGADIVESHPGTIAISEPRRAAFIEQSGDDDIVTIKGSGATKKLTVAGQPAEVAADGSFVAKVHATPGLNVIAAVDGESRLETSFLFGHFVEPITPIANAVAVSVGSRAINGALPDASLESVINLAVENRDFVHHLEGVSLGGKNYGVDWHFEVTKGSNGPTKVIFGSAAKGIAIDATIADVLVEGRLTIKAAGIDYIRGVKVTLKKGGVRGDVELAVDAEKGALKAAMPNAEATIDGFVFDTDNAGFPCCVDSIATDFIQPFIKDKVEEAIQTKVPEAVQLTLDGIGVPKKIDFKAAGFQLAMPIAARFDGGFFDREGATLTASTKFGADPKPGTPGWLSLGAPYAGQAQRASGVTVSISLDALNQLMYGAWTSGALAYDAPAPLNAHLSVAMPPVISITKEGAIRVGVGEILVERKGAGRPLAAVSVQQDVTTGTQGRSLVLTPKGAPTISVTWLADDSAGSGLNLVGQAAQEQVMQVLKPFAFPLPAFAMDRFGGGLMGHALVLDQPAVTVDTKQQRIEASGLLSLIK